LYHIQGLDSYIDPVRGVTRNFWTWDFYGILGVPLRRMVSFFLDPILLGHNITFILTITLYCTFNKTFIFNKYAMLFINIILFTGLILTMSKGAIMAFVITMLLYLKNRKTTKWLYYILLFSTVLFVSMFIKYSLNNGLAGASHFNGLTANLTSIFTNPMGVGLGFAGNMARYGHNNHADLIAGESYIGTVIGQMGLVGIIILILFIKYIVKYGKKNINNDLFNTINKAIVAVLIGNLVSSSMSESVISLTGSGMLFILFGYFSNLIDKEIQFRKESYFEK
ncbi:hypothetical protein HRF69_23280, partial [Bacillus circulans]|nr:hypothetical protein [Niallia circulans]